MCLPLLPAETVLLPSPPPIPDLLPHSPILSSILPHASPIFYASRVNPTSRLRVPVAVPALGVATHTSRPWRMLFSSGECGDADVPA